MWEVLSEFVQRVCKGRDPSHGHEHMEKVAKNARYIYENTESDYKNDHVYIMLLAASFLHDVNDYKYDPDKLLTKQMYDFLMHYFDENDTKLIMNIIDRVSYSKENNAIVLKQKLDWQEVLGDVGCFIRDIVSDADKLEAIGKIGIQRCIEYNTHKYFEKNGNNISREQLVNDIITHANEKLLRLEDEFIRTKVGKQMAEPLHEEMITAIDNIDNNEKINAVHSTS